LRLINCDELKSTNQQAHFTCEELKSTIRETITEYYAAPYKEINYHGSWEFQLKGLPWDWDGDEGISSRRLISRVSESMLRSGWGLSFALDVTLDKSILLYCRCAPQPKAKFACISLVNRFNKINLLDFSHEYRSSIRDALFDGYTLGFKSEHQIDNSCYEICVNGIPWSENNERNIHLRAAMVSVLDMASSLGWRLATSANIVAEHTHNWYFVHLPNGQAEEKQSEPPPSYWYLPSAPPDLTKSPPDYKAATAD